MAKIKIDKSKVQRKLFHNEWINVYPTTLPLDEISYWKENNRTIFTFERLCAKERKKLGDISLEKITTFIANQPIHKLQVLSDSIKRNGVQSPLVIRDDGKLLDGNRRYFACQWLKMQCASSKKPIPTTLNEIPVQVIKTADLTQELELKILAEANFIADLKVAWSLDAQARAVEEYYNSIRSKRVDDESALLEVTAVFGISRQRAKDLLDTLALTKTFISEGDAEENLRRREIVEEKFVFFWEFRNKAMKGSNALKAGRELDDATDMVFNMMAKGRDNPIKNVKQIEPLIQARRDPTAWSMLKESKGSKLGVVVSMMNEKKEVRKSDDKIRVFLAWLKDTTEFTVKARNLLKELAALASHKSKA